jgi:hypothetical protein
MKRMLYEEELERLSSNNKRELARELGSNTIRDLQEQLSSLKGNLVVIKDKSAKKNENITKLKDSIVNLTNILKKYKLDITKEYLKTISDILENKYGIESLKGEIPRKKAIVELLDKITNNKIENKELEGELERLKVANKPIYNDIINYFNKFKKYIEDYKVK